MLTASVGGGGAYAGQRAAAQSPAHAGRFVGKSSVKGVSASKRVGSSPLPANAAAASPADAWWCPHEQIEQAGKARFCVHNASCAASRYTVGTPGKRPDAQATVPSPSDVASNGVRSLAGPSCCAAHS